MIDNAYQILSDRVNAGEIPFDEAEECASMYGEPRMTREDEINQLCLLYSKRVLAQELMLALDTISLYQEYLKEKEGE